MRMQVEADLYLLDIRAFFEDENRSMLIEEALSKLDAQRREKARRIGRERGLAESLGAGLLLQLAVQRAETVRSEEAAGRAETAQAVEAAGRAELVRFTGGAATRLTVTELLKSLDASLPLVYQYKENGKPYFKNYPYYFNLSHSGDYVICALSEREVGADLQVHRATDLERLAGRYFSPAEIEAFRQAEDRTAFFFRLWARKEAYGKLTGKGIVDALGSDLWSMGTEIAGTLCWEECDKLPGYSMAVCQYTKNAVTGSEQLKNAVNKGKIIL